MERRMRGVPPLYPNINSKNMVLHYKLWAGPTSPGKVFDYSLNVNPGTLQGTDIHPTYPGFRFNGTDDYIDTGDTFQSMFRDSFSINMWVKQDDGRPPVSAYMFATLDTAGANSDISLILQTTGYLYSIYESEGNSVVTKSANAVFSNGQETWHLITLVADSTVGGVGGILFYLNGVSVALDAVNNGDTTGVNFAEYTNGYAPYIGARNSGGAPVAGSYFAGLIDEVMLFNTALTAQQVRSIFESTRWRYGV